MQHLYSAFSTRTSYTWLGDMSKHWSELAMETRVWSRDTPWTVSEASHKITYTMHYHDYYTVHHFHTSRVTHNYAFSRRDIKGGTILYAGGHAKHNTALCLDQVYTSSPLFDIMDVAIIITTIYLHSHIAVISRYQHTIILITCISFRIRYIDISRIFVSSSPLRMVNPKPVT